MSANPPVKLMIQSGLVPDNVLQQLVNWRLLPANSTELSGQSPISMEKEWDDVESFMNDLQSALDREAKTIRETDLDWAGGYHNVSLRLRGPKGEADWFAENTEVLVDALGRVILPAKAKYKDLLSITFLEEGNGHPPALREVLQVECRYRANRVVAYVVYLKEVP